MPKDTDMASQVEAADMHGAPAFIKKQLNKAKSSTGKKPLTEDQIRAIAKKNGLDADALIATNPSVAAGPDPVGVEETVNEAEERELAEAPKTVVRAPMKREYPADQSVSAATLEDFLGLGEEIGRMLANKNRKYGDSYARMAHVLPMFYPDGVPGDHLLDAVFILRIIDKLMRIASAQGDDEEDPVKDIAGYAVLRMREMRNSE
jgi:arsenate reductase-like glutaredoxin family protein